MRVLLTGASGQLGAYLLGELSREAGVELVAWCGSSGVVSSRVPLRPVDLGDPAGVEAALGSDSPDMIIHAAAMASVADCHREPDRARRVNVTGTSRLVEWAARRGARFVYVSTDLVFDGEQGNYGESDAPRPLSVYGRTKWEAEGSVERLDGSVVVRLSLMYGPSRGTRPSFFDHLVAALHGGRPFVLFEDEWRTPLDWPTAARALGQIARSNVRGVLHVGGPERMSRWEMGVRIARRLGLSTAALVRSQRSSAGFAEPRPRDTSLDSSRWRRQFPLDPWPVLDDAVDCMLSEGRDGQAVGSR